MLSQKYSIAGFFMLSAFLLTYRLLKDFNKPNSNVLLFTLQYAVRRFFRIYVVVAIFATAAVYGPPVFAGYQYGRYNSLFTILTLGFPGLNNLWTIPGEVKYYFMIPLICLMFYGARGYELHLLGCSILWTAYDHFFNFFEISWKRGIDCTNGKSNLLSNHFFVFFVGSQLAVAFFVIEQNEILMKWIQQYRVKTTLSFLSLAVAVYALLFQTEIYNHRFDHT